MGLRDVFSVTSAIDADLEGSLVARGVCTLDIRSQTLSLYIRGSPQASSSSSFRVCSSGYASACVPTLSPHRERWRHASNIPRA